MGARAVISVTSPPRHSRAILQAIRPTSCNLAQGGITAASNHSIIRSISAQSHCLQAVSALDSSKSQTVFGRAPNRPIFVQIGSLENQGKKEIILLRIFCNFHLGLFQVGDFLLQNHPFHSVLRRWTKIELLTFLISKNSLLPENFGIVLLGIFCNPDFWFFLVLQKKFFF